MHECPTLFVLTNYFVEFGSSLIYTVCDREFLVKAYTLACLHMHVIEILHKQQ